jgi:hypothetical protein
VWTWYSPSASPDHRDRVAQDDQIPGEQARRVRGGFGGGLVGVSDDDQVSHGLPFSHVPLFPPLLEGIGGRHSRWMRAIGPA